MTSDDKRGRRGLNRLAETLADDVLSMSDDEILAEFRETHGDPDRNAAEMLALFEKSVLVANKRKLTAAKAGAAAQRAATPTTAAKPIDLKAARARLRAVVDTPGAPHKLTLAARKESELSDADILGMLEDMRELGVLPPDED